MTSDISELRRDYRLRALRRGDLAADPIEQFHRWFQEAIASELPEPNAMVLATADAQGVPSARTVLLKAADSRGFVFFTNYESNKGKQLAENPNAALVFHWNGLERQVLIAGAVEKVGREESERYFHQRPRGSQLGAWASLQSSTVPDRETLEQRFQEVEQRFGNDEIPLPEFWGGFLVRPRSIEFWQGRTSRLHDRLRYTRNGTDWVIQRLSP